MKFVNGLYIGNIKPILNKYTDITTNAEYYPSQFYANAYRLIIEKGKAQNIIEPINGQSIIESYNNLSTKLKITAYIIGNQYTKEIPLNETTSINGYNDFNITNPVQTNMAPIVKQQTESSPYLQLRNFLQLYNSPNPIPVYEALVNVQNTITDGENMFLFSGKTLRYGYLDNSPNVIYVEFEMLKYNKQNEILII